MQNNQIKWRNEKRFIYLAAACAFLTAFTTIAIHQVNIPSGSFEDSVQLYKNNAYCWLNWIILFHCLLVLFSMLGVALVIEKHFRALAILGFIFFLLFVFSEWERTLNNLWHINGLRAKYAATVEENTLQFLRFEIQQNLHQSNVYFLLFTIGLSLGNASYGAAIINSTGLDRYLGAGLLLWAGCSSLAFIYDFYPAKWMETIAEACNNFYQPIIRLLIAYWLFQQAKKSAIKPQDD